jgi:hypothetical protein
LNAGAAGLDYGARTAVEFIVNPILVSTLGTYLYGAWRVLWRLTGYLWAAGGRSAQALQAAVANRQLVADDDERRRLVGASVVVWMLFLPLLAGIGAVGVWLAPALLDTPARHVGGVRFAAALLCLDSIALTVLTVPKSVLQGQNLGYKRLGLSTALVLLLGATTVAAVELGAGIAGVAGAHLANTVLTGFLFWRIAARHVSWFGLARPRRREVRWFLGLSSWFTAWKFVSQLLIAGDVAVLAFIGSVPLVTTYTFMKFVPEAVLPLLALLVQGGIPGLGGILGAGQLERARAIRSEIMAVTWLVATVASVTMLVWNRSFVGLWVGDEFFAGELQGLLIITTLLQLSIVRNDAFIIDLTLDVKAKVLLGLASAVVSLGLAAALVGFADAGITGLCIGLIVGRLLLSLCYPAVIGRAIGHPIGDQLGAAVRPALVTALLFVAALALADDLAVESWPVLLAAAPITAVALVPLVALLGLTRGQRGRLQQRVAKVLARPPSSGAGAGEGGAR